MSLCNSCRSPIPTAAAAALARRIDEHDSPPTAEEWQRIRDDARAIAASRPTPRPARRPEVVDLLTEATEGDYIRDEKPPTHVLRLIFRLVEALDAAESARARLDAAYSLVWETDETRDGIFRASCVSDPSRVGRMLAGYFFDVLDDPSLVAVEPNPPGPNNDPSRVTTAPGYVRNLTSEPIKNYLELSFVDPRRGRVTVTIQRPGAKTPHGLRLAAERERDEALEKLDKATRSGRAAAVDSDADPGHLRAMIASWQHRLDAAVNLLVDGMTARSLVVQVLDEMKASRAPAPAAPTDQTAHDDNPADDTADIAVDASDTADPDPDEIPMDPDWEAIDAMEEAKELQS